MEYVDILFLHRYDAHTPIEESVRAVNEIIEDGKALYWGTSEWSPAQIGEAMRVANRLKLIKPITDQCRYNILNRENVESKMRPMFEAFNFGNIAFSPLEYGMLTGKYNKKGGGSGRLTEDNSYMKSFMKGLGLTEGEETKEGEILLEKLTKLGELAEKLECTQPQLAVAWVLANMDVDCCILGATKLS